MTEQTKAQRLARDLANAAQFPAYPPTGRFAECAAELRRLDANEAALVEAVHAVQAAKAAEGKPTGGWVPKAGTYVWQRGVALAHQNLNEIITRIEAERNAK